LVLLFIVNETKILAKNKILIETYKVSNFSSSAISHYSKREILLNMFFWTSIC